MEKYHFDAFQHVKYFEKQPQIQFQKYRTRKIK